MSRQRDLRIASQVESWFRRCARDLPWRPESGASPSASGRDPYVALVSEIMLQQTQVVRVQELLPGFLERFPDVHSLARAREQSVLAAWSGLGYYRRARLLHRAARAIVRDHGGVVPSDAATLRNLPGVGRYTAGALASLVFHQREPAVDGNVERVIIRLEGRDVDELPASRSAWVWQRASELVRLADDPAALNEGLIELGAIVCTPRAPRCDDCPLRRSCRARREGIEKDIPRAKSPITKTIVRHSAVVIIDVRGRVLVEQRPSRGLWASMWQAPTIETNGRFPGHARLRRDLEARLGRSLLDLQSRQGFDHATSHRLVRFRVWSASLRAGRAPDKTRFVSRAQLRSLPVANPHRRILEMKF